MTNQQERLVGQQPFGGGRASGTMIKQEGNEFNAMDDCQNN